MVLVLRIILSKERLVGNTVRAYTWVLLQNIKIIALPYGQNYPHLKSLRKLRPVALPAVLRATLLPTLPFLMALASPISRATLYKELRNPIGLPR